MSQPSGHAGRASRAWPAAIASVVLVVAAIAIGRLPVARLVTLVPDDGYFYIKTAWHLAQGHGSTFDGLNATNGYHPLYLGLLTLLSTVVPLQGAAGLHAVVWFDLMSRGVWLWVMAALAGELGWPRWATWAVVFALLPIAAAGNFGLEVNVLLPLAWGYVLLVRRSRGRAGVEAAAGLVGALTCLARLDAILFVGAVAGGAVWTSAPAWRRAAGIGLRLLGPPVAALGGLALWNLRTYGRTTTVSSWLKMGPQPPMSALGGQLELSTDTVLLGLALATSLAAVVRAVRSRAAADVPMGALGLWCLVYVPVLQSLLRGGMEAWYYPLPLSAGLVMALDLARHWRSPRRPVIRMALCGLLAAAGLWATAQSGRRLLWREWLFTDGLAASHWIDTRLPRDARLYQVDAAGLVGYFANRAVINGDGLINSWAYQAELRAGRLPEYLARMGVEYVVFDDFKGEAEIEILVPYWNAPAATLYFARPPERLAEFGSYLILRIDPREARVTRPGERPVRGRP